MVNYTIKINKTKISLFNENNYEKVLNIFFENPTSKFYIRQLAQLTNLNPNTIINICNVLLKEDLIQREKKTYIVEISANFDEKFKRLKIIHNLKKIYKSGIIEFLNNDYKNPKSIVLFGSFRQGEDIIASDIDIAIESEDFKKYQVIELENKSGFEKKFNKKIQLHLFNKNNVDLNVFNNIANGIVLSGFLEVKK